MNKRNTLSPLLGGLLLVAVVAAAVMPVAAGPATARADDGGGVGRQQELCSYFLTVARSGGQPGTGGADLPGPGGENGGGGSAWDRFRAKVGDVVGGMGSAVAGLGDALNPVSWVRKLVEATAGMVEGVLRWFLPDFTPLLTCTDPKLTFDNPVVRGFHEAMLTATAGVLAAVLMWGGITIMAGRATGIPYHDVMELLPRAAIAFVIARLSYWLVALLVGLNNAFIGILRTSVLPGDPDAFLTENFVNSLARDVDGLGPAVVLKVAGAVLMLMLLFQVLERIVLVAILTVAAPLAIMAWVLPQTRRWGEIYAHLLPAVVFQQFFQFLVVSVATALALYVAGRGGAAGVELSPATFGWAGVGIGIAGLMAALQVPRLLQGGSFSFFAIPLSLWTAQAIAQFRHWSAQQAAAARLAQRGAVQAAAAEARRDGGGV